MAKEGYSPDYEPYMRGQKVFVRVRHNRIRSPRLEGFLSCMHSQMEGRRFRTGSAREDTEEVRAAFTQASHLCSAQAGRGFRG